MELTSPKADGVALILRASHDGHWEFKKPKQNTIACKVQKPIAFPRNIIWSNIVTKLILDGDVIIWKSLRPSTAQTLHPHA